MQHTAVLQETDLQPRPPVQVVASVLPLQEHHLAVFTGSVEFEQAVPDGSEM